jgi:hypothetical protein
MSELLIGLALATGLIFAGQFAAATPHTRAARRHRRVIRPVVHVHRALMAAALAGHEQATDSVPPHAAEPNGTDRFVILSHATSQGTKSSGSLPVITPLRRVIA